MQQHGRWGQEEENGMGNGNGRGEERANKTLRGGGWRRRGGGEDRKIDKQGERVGLSEL